MIPIFYLFSEWGLLFLRIVVGAIMVVHGKPKIENMEKTKSDFSDMGFRPAFFWGWLVAMLEFIGGIALILGFLTQLFALLFFIQFLVILFTVKKEANFRGGYEFPLLILVSSLVLLTSGGGLYTLDKILNLIFY
ncbi:MAG: DoxX family protein [Candidatus Magasanikbacteria bacterium]